MKTNLVRFLKQKKEAQILVFVIIIGAGLRLNGLLWDAPYFFNPDEKDLVNWGMRFDYLNPGVSEWGALPLLLVRLINVGLNLFYMVERADIYVIVRSLAVVLGVSAIFLVYRLGLRAYDRLTAIYGAIFTAFTVLYIQYSHFYSLDGVFAFFVLVAFLPIFAIAQIGSSKYYLLAGLTIGLVIAARFNGWFLLVPLFVAHYCHILQLNPGQSGRLSGADWWQHYLALLFRALLDKKFLFAVLLSVAIFVMFTPTAILNPSKYLFYDGLIWVLLQTNGYLKSQYTLQFEGTTPWYYISNLLFWAVGPFLLLAYLAGLLHSIIRWREQKNLIILSFLLVFFGLAIGSRAKFIRYSLPALPLLNIVAAQFFATAQKTAREKPIMKWAIAGWLGVTIIGSGLYALAFSNIYSRPDIRIVAAEWIHKNIPPGSRIVFENDISYAPPIGFYDEDQTKYHFEEINYNYLYESSSVNQESHLPPLLVDLNVNVTRRGEAGIFIEDEALLLTDEQKWQYLRQRLSCADYVVFSDRHYTVYRDRVDLFPVESEYYTKLFDGRLGFRPIKVFERKPGLSGWSIDDSQAELTFRIFDHPTIWIFQSQLPKEYLEQYPPQSQTLSTWANRVKLVGYDIDEIVVQPGGELELTLYWEALADMHRDFTIFLQLQDGSHKIIAQNDYQVAEGLLPTSCWLPERIVSDTTRLPIPVNVPPGSYQLKLGLYFFETLERLPIVDDTSGENAFLVTKIGIQEK